jgi:aspartate/methionine/tyrosine aminotransferase
MVQIQPFEVEQWMDTYETTPGVLNIAETCCSSLSVNRLMDLDESGAASSPIDISTRLDYGAILGSEELRGNIASTYADEKSEPLSPRSIVVTQGAISANYLVMYSLIGPGDHVVCVYPTYQQLYTVPRSLGADVSLWKLQPENNFALDVAELQALIQSNTKVQPS